MKGFETLVAQVGPSFLVETESTNDIAYVVAVGSHGDRPGDAVDRTGMLLRMKALFPKRSPSARYAGLFILSEESRRIFAQARVDAASMLWGPWIPGRRDAYFIFRVSP